MLATLNDILAYKNLQVIARYQKEYPNNSLDAQTAFRELKKFLWLSRLHHIELKNDPHNIDLQFRSEIHTEMSEIDDMWHVFILFTRDYHHFCENYLGGYLHHEPNEHQNRVDSQEFELNLSRFLSYAYDHLGDETIKLWFSELLQDLA